MISLFDDSNYQSAVHKAILLNDAFSIETKKRLLSDRRGSIA